MRSQTLVKLFLVVFAGVLAALLVYSAPGWWRKHEAEQEAEQETLRRLRIDSLTPAGVIADCGKPKKDDQENEGDGLFFRTLTYPSKGLQDTVQLSFMGNETPTAGGKKQISWNFSGANGTTMEPDDLLWALPCAFPPRPQ